MLVRDSGVIQLFAESAQEAYDLMVIAPRLAEHPDVLLPVLVCQDGFTITHSAEPVRLLEDEDVRAFVGEYRIPSPVLDVAHATTQGPFAMPDYYFELRHQQLAAMHAALDVIDEIACEYGVLSGRRIRPVEPYRLDGAEHVLVCLGSTGGTAKDVVDELQDEGEPVGLVELHSFRPLPRCDLRALLAARSTVTVLDRADSPGGAPPLFAEIAAALTGTSAVLRSVVYGLGGRDLHPDDIRRIYAGNDARAYAGLRGVPCPA
jgi:pyruvate ferredoxin oxidoreductase alpha subunit